MKLISIENDRQESLFDSILYFNDNEYYTDRNYNIWTLDKEDGVTGRLWGHYKNHYIIKHSFQYYEATRF